MTNKQQNAAKKKVALTIANGGKEPKISTVMREVGYSEATIHTPSKLTGTDGWLEALDKYLPDEKILRKHDEALEATKTISAKIVGMDANEGTDDFIEVPDHPTRLKAVELAYKVKKRFEDVVDNSKTLNMNVNFFDASTIHPLADGSSPGQS